MLPEMAEAFEAFKKYVALKNHFTQPKYDYFKYNGHVKVSPTTFETRSDKYFFYKLAKQKNIEQFLVASFVDEGPTQWVGDLIEQMKANNTYAKWLKRQESISYQFQSDLECLDDDYNKNIVVAKNDHPKLLKLYLQKKICIETLIILDELSSFAKYWAKNIEETVVWPDVHLKMKKYKPFVRFDKDKCRQIAIKRFLNS